MQQFNDAQRVQDYYRQRQQQPGWFNLVQALFSGILTSAEDEDAREFLKMIGGNLAAQHTLPAAGTVGELEDNLNALLARFDWGVVSIDATGQYLSLRHLAWPVPSQGQDDILWQTALIAVLEGAYGQWLNAQSNHAQVPVHWLETTAEGGFVFRYQNGL
ncbi:MAG: cellulose biosynthesis protein BcsD [Rouxiella aceris]|uniref:cellulose biosynthesis protein BcsD n=1 Tax=Rouxiella aceris TaxID=2703884 RepID=UPI00283F0DD8|nr:cellulose biosynthesis protein BcsD [Rouxiella aceris]MDR3431174.1 cellulose biosynthesis protein BcsD [Rouxiella aceris]